MPMEQNVNIVYTNDNFMPQQLAQMGSGLVQAAAGLAQAAAGLAEAAKIMQIAAGTHLPANQPFHSSQHTMHFYPPSNCYMPNFAVPPFMPRFDNWPETSTDVTKPTADENSITVTIEPLIPNVQCLQLAESEVHIECVEATDNAVETAQCNEISDEPVEVVIESNNKPEPAFKPQNRRSSKKSAVKKKKHACKAADPVDVSSVTKAESNQQKHAALELENEDCEIQQRALPAVDVQVLQSYSNNSMQASDELPLALCDETAANASPPYSSKQRKKSKSTASGGKNNAKPGAQIIIRIKSAQILEKVGDALHTCEEKHYSLSLDNFEYVQNELRKLDLTEDGMVDAVTDMVFDAACSDLAAVGVCAQMICSMTSAEPNDLDESVVELIRERVTWRIERSFRSIDVVKVLKKNHGGTNAKQEVQTALSVVNEQFGATIQLAGQLYVEQYYRNQFISTKALLNYMERLLPNSTLECDFEAEGKCTANPKQKLRWLCDLIMHVGHVLASEDADINAEPSNILGRLNEICCQKKAVDLYLKNEIVEIFEWKKSGWDAALARTYVKQKFDIRGRDVRLQQMQQRGMAAGQHKSSNKVCAVRHDHDVPAAVERAPGGGQPAGAGINGPVGGGAPQQPQPQAKGNGQQNNNGADQQSPASPKSSAGAAQQAPAGPQPVSVRQQSSRSAAGGSQANAAAAGKPAPANDIIDAAKLATMDKSTQKTVLGEKLYPKIREFCPDFVGKITGMLLESMDSSDLLLMIEDTGFHFMKKKVDEAAELLRASQKPAPGTGGNTTAAAPAQPSVQPTLSEESRLPSTETVQNSEHVEPTGNAEKIAETPAVVQQKTVSQKKNSVARKAACVNNTPPSANGKKAIFLRNCRERMIRFMPLSDSCEPPDEKLSKSITWIVERCQINDDDMRNECLEPIYENLHIMLITIGLENFHDAVTQLDHIFSEWYGDDMVEYVVDMIFDVACTPGYFENIGMYAELILFLMTFGPIENSNGEHVWKLVRDKLMLLIQQKFARFDELDAVITNKKSDAKLIDENMKSWDSEGFNGAIQFLGQLYLEQWFADQILSPKKLLKYLNRLLPNRKRDFTQAGKCTEFAEKKLEWLCELIMNVGHVLADEGGDIDAEPLRILMRFENLCEQNAISDKLRSVLQEVIDWHHSGWNPDLAHRNFEKWIMLEGPDINYRLI